MMSTILYVLPIFSIISAVLIYRLNGKREFLRFDFVQFVYAFIILPFLFIWLKSFLFFLLRRELNLFLSVGNIFFVDTVFSTFFMFIYAFAVVHSLTASFKLKKVTDPLYDLFQHSEYFHLWLSHLVVYGGAVVIATFFSVVNIFIPTTLVMPKVSFYLFLFGSLICGVFAFIGLLNSDPKQANFMRIMKLMFSLTFLIHVILYFVFDPDFNASRLFYWMIFMALIAIVFGSVFAERSEKAMSFADRFKYKVGWDYRVDLNLFPKKKSKKKLKLL